MIDLVSALLMLLECVAKSSYGIVLPQNYVFSISFDLLFASDTVLHLCKLTYMYLLLAP